MTAVRPFQLRRTYIHSSKHNLADLQVGIVDILTSLHADLILGAGTGSTGIGGAKSLEISLVTQRNCASRLHWRRPPNPSHWGVALEINRRGVRHASYASAPSRYRPAALTGYCCSHEMDG